jgi:hypothetical protein
MNCYNVIRLADRKSEMGGLGKKIYNTQNWAGIHLVRKIRYTLKRIYAKHKNPGVTIFKQLHREKKKQKIYI